MICSSPNLLRHICLPPSSDGLYLKTRMFSGCRPYADRTCRMDPLHRLESASSSWRLSVSIESTSPVFKSCLNERDYSIFTNKPRDRAASNIALKKKNASVK
jgi:hypothetical protein